MGCPGGTTVAEQQELSTLLAAVKITHSIVFLRIASGFNLRF